MNRSLQASRRPFIAFTVVLSPVVLIWLFVCVQKGFRRDLLQAGLLLLVLYLVILVAAYSQHVSVSEHGLDIVCLCVSRRFIPFEQIDHSNVQVLLERDWPVSLTIYGNRQRTPLARIGLKAIRKEDAAWLCSLPEIKAVNYDHEEA
jgi:hypothetical protein